MLVCVALFWGWGEVIFLVTLQPSLSVALYILGSNIGGAGWRGWGGLDVCVQRVVGLSMIPACGKGVSPGSNCPTNKPRVLSSSDVNLVL